MKLLTILANVIQELLSVGQPNQEKTYPEASEDVTPFVVITESKAQEILKKHGYYKGDIDGILGSVSVKAITKFQSDNGLPLTSELDNPTKGLLLSRDSKEPVKKTTNYRKMSREGVMFLADYEALYLKAYKDAVGKWTIGYGHLMLNEEMRTGVIKTSKGDVHWRNGITNEQAITIFEDEIIDHEVNLDKSVPEDLPQHKFDALCIFSFNCGKGSVRGSRESGMMKLIRSGNYDGSFPKYASQWVNGTRKGKKIRLKGLENRRAEEIEMWEKADYVRQR